MMTPIEAKKAADEVKAEIQKHQETIVVLERQYASLMRIYFGDNLHDAHNQREMEKTLASIQWVDWYWSDEQKAVRAAAEQAERQQREQAHAPALSADQQKAEKVLSEIAPLRQRQQKR